MYKLLFEVNAKVSHICDLSAIILGLPVFVVDIIKQLIIMNDKKLIVFFLYKEKKEVDVFF